MTPDKSPSSAPRKETDEELAESYRKGWKAGHADASTNIMRECFNVVDRELKLRQGDSDGLLRHVLLGIAASLQGVEVKFASSAPSSDTAGKAVAWAVVGSDGSIRPWDSKHEAEYRANELTKSIPRGAPYSVRPLVFASSPVQQGPTRGEMLEALSRAELCDDCATGMVSAIGQCLSCNARRAEAILALLRREEQ